MRVRFTSIAWAGALSLLLSCSSQPLDDGATLGGASGTGGHSPTAGAGSGAPSACSGALRQSLSLIDQVSTGAVSVISDTGAERTLYIDASVGGINGQDKSPWVYVSLASGQAVAVTDIDALSSTAWDLAFKRFVVRTNGGDSGPGQGGAIRIALPWAKVDASTLGQQTLPKETWFDADCNLNVDQNMELITTFTGWSQYDEALHVLNATPDVVYITAAADGSLYKVAILDYYSTPSGAHGSVAGHYKVQVAPLQ